VDKGKCTTLQAWAARGRRRRVQCARPIISTTACHTRGFVVSRTLRVPASRREPCDLQDKTGAPAVGAGHMADRPDRELSSGERLAQPEARLTGTMCPARRETSALRGEPQPNRERRVPSGCERSPTRHFTSRRADLTGLRLAHCGKCPAHRGPTRLHKWPALRMGT